MTQFQRQAEWIWRWRDLTAVPLGTAAANRAAEEANRTVYFRRVFEAASPGAAMPIFVSADGRYQLFVNGKRIGRGPARCSPERQCVDTYDLQSFLQPGRNVLAALVRAYGRHTAWYELPRWEHGRLFGCGGFFLQGSGQLRQIDTGEGWRYLEAEAWEKDVPSGSQGFVERFDARLEPIGWTTVAFDDSGWKRAEILRLPGVNFSSDVTPFPVMVLRNIPHLQEERLQPAAIFALGERTRVVDFGRLVNGRFQLDVTGKAGTVLEISYGERRHTDGLVKPNEGIPGYDTPYIHQLTLRDGRQQWELFEWASFRYVQVAIQRLEIGEKETANLQIHQLNVNQVSYPVQENGRFTCSDTQLNRLWQAGADTVHACMHDAYMDCPTREQRQYVADAYVQMLVNFAAFGDGKLAARMLRQVAQSQHPSGLMMPAAPGDFARLSSFNIPDFTLYWILAMEKYVLYTGDTSVLRDHYPAIGKALSWFSQFINADHLLADLPHWVFVDWAELNKQGQVTALNAQFVAALQAAAVLAAQLEQVGDAARWQETAAATANAINTYLWDEIRGVYVDARDSRRVSQQSNAAAVAFGAAPPERWLRIFNMILDEPRLRLTRLGDHDPTSIPFDEETDVVLTQPFYAHHLHVALRRAGEYGRIRRSLRRWEPMLDEDNGLFRETWQVHDDTSLCHGWASTPTFDLSTDVLGVVPTSPGFQTFRVQPQPGDLSWANGAFPTPHGNIEVDWTQENGRFALTLTVPEGTEAEVILGTAVKTVGAGTHQFT